MRVFDAYRFNIISKVQFKDTKPYLDQMLKELGNCYQEISFSMDPYRPRLEQFLERYPNLKKYRYYVEWPSEKDFLTSLTPEWAEGKIYADKEDWESVFSIASKVPRGNNLDIGIVMDKIDWYGEGVKEAAVRQHEMYDGKAVEWDFPSSHSPVINSQILMRRGAFHYGNKFNEVWVVVEATAKKAGGIPRDTADILQKLSPYLGEPISSSRIVRFEPEQQKIYDSERQECARLLEDRMKELDREEKQAGREVEAVDLFERPFIPQLADKKKVTSAFKKYGFRRAKPGTFPPGMNGMVLREKHGFWVEIWIDRRPGSPDFFYFYYNIEGFNFNLSSGQHTVYAGSEEEAERKLSRLAELCSDLNEEFGELLSEKFGDTPDWFQYENE